MTMTDEPTELTDDEARALADRIWADRNGNISGAELARECGRSARWGTKQTARLRGTTGTASVPTPRAEPVPTGTPPAEPAARPTVPPRPAPARHAARPEADAGTRDWADKVVVLIVALVAALGSYGHMRHVALMAGEAEWFTWLFPLTVDGLALAALRRGEQGRAWLALAIVVGVVANVGAYYPDAVTVAAPAVFAWPPLALYGTHRLLRMQER